MSRERLLDGGGVSRRWPRSGPCPGCELETVPRQDEHSRALDRPQRSRDGSGCSLGRRVGDI